MKHSNHSPALDGLVFATDCTLYIVQIVQFIYCPVSVYAQCTLSK